MATVSKVRTLINPGRRRKRNGIVSSAKRKLSPLQKLFFGSKRQRSAVANSGVRKRKRNSSREAIGAGSMRKTKKYVRRITSYKPIKRAKILVKASRKRKRNVGSILTVWPMGNPGRKRKVVRRKRNSAKRVVVINKGEKMATLKRRVRRTSKRRVSRRRRNYGTQAGRSWSTYSSKRSQGSAKRRRRNPGRKMYSRRRRHSNPSVRRHRTYRRNPGVMSGTVGKVLGMVGGIAATRLLMGFVPAQFNSGIIGVAATAVVAVAQGKLVGKLTKSSAMGNDFMIGGLALAAVKLLGQFFPDLSQYTGISGMGLIGPSSFYVPQVNQNGSMGQFVLPAAVGMNMPVAAPANSGLKGMRRTGRVM